MRHSLKIIAALAALGATARAEDDFAEKLRQAQLAQNAAPAPAAPAVPVKKATKKAAAMAIPAALSPAAEVDSMAEINGRLAALEKFKGGLERFKFEGFSHLRYESQDSRKVRGAYVRRAELKIAGKLADGYSSVIGYDLAENKLKDIGLEAEFPGLKIQLGQFRQKFGIEPQTGSLKTMFAERAMMYGGLQPLTGSAKMVGERVMGLHAIHKKKLGHFSYEAGLSLANNLSEDQAAGKNKISATDAFTKQPADENPSATGRISLELSWAKGKAGLGASYARDSQNSVFLASRPADQRAEEFSGLDTALEINDLIKFQAEWIAANLIRGDLGLSQHREGWYAQGSLQPLRPFMADAPKLELLARFENLQPGDLAAVTGAIKFSFLGNQQLILQYSAFAPMQDFGAGAGSELWVLQQQLQF